MRRTRHTLGLLFLFAVGLGGCALTDQEVKPPRPAEEFNAPPDNDPRYSSKIEYPRHTMEQDVLLKRKEGLKGTPGPMTSPRQQQAGGLRPGM